jgi:hypothetical protein
LPREEENTQEEKGRAPGKYSYGCFVKRLILLLPLVTLLIAPGAGAAIPGIEKTPAYKNLKNYVTFLQSQSTVPVTDEQRAAYQADLERKKAKALQKVEALYGQRRTKKINTYKRNLKKAIKTINKSKKKNLAAALANYKQKISDDNAVYQGALQRIYAKYDGKIARVQQKIKKTKKQLKKATNLLKIEILETRLEALRSQKDSLINFRASAKRIALNNYKEIIREDTAAYNRKVNRIKRRAERNINKQKKTRKRNKNSSLANIKTRKTKETALVDSLAKKGQVAINAMPAIVTDQSRPR